MATLTESKCKECKTGKLEIVGTAGFDDMVEVHCTNPSCDETYEVEPDGLNMAGDDMLIALMEDFDSGDMEDASADIDDYLKRNSNASKN